MENMGQSDRTSNLRYALEVLDEYKHLGLDNQYANKLHEILERQLGEAGELASCCPAQPIRLPNDNG